MSLISPSRLGSEGSSCSITIPGATDEELDDRLTRARERLSETDMAREGLTVRF